MMTHRSIHVLVVDDCPEDRELYRRYLTNDDRSGFVISEADSAEQGIQLSQSKHPDCIILDYNLPDFDGLVFLDALAKDQTQASIPVVMLTGQGDESVAMAALNRGAQDYLIKGMVTADGLERSIRHAMQRQQIYQENERLVEELGSALTQLGEAKGLLEKKNRHLAELYDKAHEFVDNVSHEFRTPLTVIKEFTSIVREGLVGEVNQEQAECLDSVAHRVEDLATMVDDMLDISKLEAGVLGVSRKDCRLADLLDRIRTTLERKAASNHVSLETVVEDDLPTIHCDAEKIGRVIINLAVNAFKFSHEGGRVRIEACHVPAESQVIVRVIDEGPGIAPENLKAIFKRFKQIGGEVRASTKGFGLGLNIAKELVHLNFGDMDVKSTVGEGSTFSFTVPIADPSKLIVRYLDRVDTVPSGSEYVSLVRGEVDPLADACVLDDLDAFLQGQLCRNDLLFRVSSHGWLLVVATERQELGQQLRRVMQAWKEANRNRPTGLLPPITLESEGTWHVWTHRIDFLAKFEQAMHPSEPVDV